MSAQWVERAALRYTPAGLPALDLTLEHRGNAVEAGKPRQVELQIRAVAIGPLAQQLQAVPAESLALWSGFLAPARNGKGVVMHITAVTPANT
ncbi:primosomal replication protein N [Inhella inkyongensis]|uniref:Primosomal replication protein N n=1 Tax=Inhella inkyongensis TaxID=392593 RepID=A0A840S5K5_9BURK|nr:primosomal replication protein N [Inhella inkyongensis]MBB5203769.1 primosomal replication protein N [Inhella inkyongensis]